LKRAALVESILHKKSYLCTGIDPEVNKLPLHFPKNPDSLIEFNRNIIEATLPYSVAYKLNTAFFEQYGAKGWEILEQTKAFIPKNTFSIADAKRGDIGNTSSMYAKAFFDHMDFDAVTVAPYMGEDSLRPFLEFKDKWIICLALTSNSGSKDFQHLEFNQKRLFETVIETVCKWGNPDNLMFVTGATQASELSNIRKIIPEHFLLVPGVGAQGGTVDEVSAHGANKQIGLLVNSSRGILYAGNGEDYAQKAGNAAQELQSQMKTWVEKIS
jgi:orotidine-5'-phosphate decarboxylase